MSDDRRYGELRQHLQPADDHLGRVDDAGDVGEDPDRGVARTRAVRAPDERADDDSGGDGCEPVDEHRRCVTAELRQQRAVHERPVVERKTGILSPDVRTDEDQQERGDRRGGGQLLDRPPDRLLPHTGCRALATIRTDRYPNEQPDQDHRRTDVNGYERRVQPGVHDDRSEPRLHEDHEQCDESCDEQRPVPAMSAHRDQSGDGEQRDRDRADGTV